MAVFRIEKTRDYTVMSNHHLKNTALTLKAKGLLSMILSLPDEWNYTTRRLAAICKEGVDAIGKALKELENEGYLVRHQLRGKDGRISDTEYVIHEQPQPQPDIPPPDTEKPYLDKSDMVLSDTENPSQLNTKKSITKLSSTESSNPIQSNLYEPQAADGIGMDTRETYREIILENIDYDIIVQDKQLDRDRLDEIVELLVDTVCSARKTIRVSGDDFPAEVVKSRLLKLDGEHIRYVLDCMAENTTYVRNIKKYLLAALFNAPSTIGNYYSALVNHDLYGGGERGK